VVYGPAGRGTSRKPRKLELELGVTWREWGGSFETDSSHHPKLWAAAAGGKNSGNGGAK